MSIQGVPKKMRHLFSLISPSVLMVQDNALYGQLEDALPFVLHIGSGLSNKRFSRYSRFGLDYHITHEIILKVYNPYTGEFIKMVNRGSNQQKRNSSH